MVILSACVCANDDGNDAVQEEQQEKNQRQQLRGITMKMEKNKIQLLRARPAQWLARN